MEFLLVGLPMLGLTLVTCQLLFASYCKTVALDAAAEAAQTAALADSNQQIAVARGERVLALAIPFVRSQVELEETRIAGRQVTKARVSIAAQNFLAGLTWLETEATAINENQ